MQSAGASEPPLKLLPNRIFSLVGVQKRRLFIRQSHSNTIGELWLLNSSSIISRDRHLQNKLTFIQSLQITASKTYIYPTQEFQTTSVFICGYLW